MDSAAYRDFSVAKVGAETVTLRKLSNSQSIDIPLRSIREITPSVNSQPPFIALRGALCWYEDIQLWRFCTAQQVRDQRLRANALF
jgi:hypothetical protein